jgi:hypothetical protein
VNEGERQGIVSFVRELLKLPLPVTCVAAATAIGLTANDCRGCRRTGAVL